MSELYQHSTQQWDDMYADRQRAKQEIGELKIRHFLQQSYKSTLWSSSNFLQENQSQSRNQ